MAKELNPLQMPKSPEYNRDDKSWVTMDCRGDFTLHGKDLNHAEWVSRQNFEEYAGILEARLREKGKVK